MIENLFNLVWDKVPWWLKWPVVILSIPVLFTLWFVSWHNNSIQASLIPVKEMHVLQMSEMEKRHSLEIGYIKDGISRIEHQNTEIYKTLLRR